MLLNHMGWICVEMRGNIPMIFSESHNKDSGLTHCCGEEFRERQVCGRLVAVLQELLVDLNQVRRRRKGVPRCLLITS